MDSGFDAKMPRKPEVASIDRPFTRNGNTELHELCANNRPAEEIRRVVLELGANTEILNNDLLPPLGVALLNANLEAAQCLIDLGARLCFPIGDGKYFNAAAIATSSGRLNVLKFVLENGGGVHVNQPSFYKVGKDSLPCLTIAVRDNHPQMLDALIGAGAFLGQECGILPLTPLQWAASEGKTDTIEKLVSCGADIDYPQSSTGMTALHYAALEGKADAVERLLQFGANPDAQNFAGVTSLMLAASRDDLRSVAALIKAQADVNLKCWIDEQGAALHAAAAKGNDSLVRRLLEAGADPLLTDAFNHRASYRAEDKSQKFTAKILREAEEDKEQKIFEKAYRKFLK